MHKESARAQAIKAIEKKRRIFGVVAAIMQVASAANGIQ